jgi:hypothetical protein
MSSRDTEQLFGAVGRLFHASKTILKPRSELIGDQPIVDATANPALDHDAIGTHKSEVLGSTRMRDAERLLQRVDILFAIAEQLDNADPMGMPEDPEQGSELFIAESNLWHAIPTSTIARRRTETTVESKNTSTDAIHDQDPSLPINGAGPKTWSDRHSPELYQFASCLGSRHQPESARDAGATKDS